MSTRFRRPVLSTLALLLLVSGCDGSLSRAQSVLRIGYAVEAPYAFLAADGTVTGEAPEIARVIAKRLALGRLEWRQLEFARLIEELRAGKIDVVAAGMFITAARSRLVAFSQPTFEVREAFLVAAGNPRGLVSFTKPDPDRSPRLAVLTGAVEADFLVSRGWSREHLYPVPDALTGLRVVQEGRTDGLVLSAPTLRTMAAQVPPGTLEVVVPTEGQNPGNRGGFAFRQEDRALREAWDAALDEFVGTAEHQTLVAPYGFTAGELP